MKHLQRALAGLTVLALVFSLMCSFFALAEEDTQDVSFRDVLPVSVAVREAAGASDSIVRYPEFISDDPAFAAALESVNQAIREKAHIDEYLQLLIAIQEGATGLQMDYQMGMGSYYAANEGPKIYGRYVSILFSAEGRMLSGRPSQVYYPMTFDLLTGNEITFEKVFSDSDGARAFIEKTLEEEVEPTLSTYLENNQLFPVPFDRFWLDSFGHVNFYYENSQLSFLSGRSGGVSFRYSELSDYLDLTDDGVVPQLSYLSVQSSKSFEQRGQDVLQYLAGGSLVFDGEGGIFLSEEVSMALEDRPAAADSGYYPGGAYFEVEAPLYRGTLILTDESEETVTGMLSSRCDLYDLQTGKTTLQDAIRFLGREPDTQMQMDEGMAEAYLVCPGTAAVYRLSGYDGPMRLFTLYADEAGVVQYLKLALENK